MAVGKRLAKLEPRGSRVPLTGIPHPLQRARHRRREVPPRKHEVLEVGQRSLRHERELPVRALLHLEDKREHLRDGTRDVRDAPVFRQLDHREERTLEPVLAPPLGSLKPLSLRLGIGRTVQVHDDDAGIVGIPPAR